MLLIPNQEQIEGQLTLFLLFTNLTFLNMTYKLDPEDRVLEKLFKEEVSKRNDKELDDKYNYDTNSK